MFRAARPFCAMVVFVAACGGFDRPSFEDGGVDSGLECSADLPCEMGRVCLSGHCFAPCSATAPCAHGETCTMGACLPQAGPPPPEDAGFDAGPGPDEGGVDATVGDAGVDAGVDAGPSVCAMSMCRAPTVCHPGTGACVECMDGSGCTMGAPTCDLASGACGDFDPGACSPCDDASDCTPGSMCLLRRSPSVERVCLPACDTGCPAGMTCDMTSRVCVPSAGSCTELYRGAQAQPCTMDLDCVPLGVTMPPPRCVSMVCHAPCAIDADCPRMGQRCVGEVCI